MEQQVSDEATKKDFESDWKNHHYHFPYIELIEANPDFKQVFYEEFSRLPAKAKPRTYRRHFISDEEWENDFGNRRLGTSELENKLHDLENEFFELLHKSDLPSYGYGRFLQDTGTAVILTAINNEIQNFRDYVLTNTDEHQYNAYAKITATQILLKVESLSIPGLAKEVIDSLFTKGRFRGWDFKTPYDEMNEAQRKDVQRRYVELKKYFVFALKNGTQNHLYTEPDVNNTQSLKQNTEDINDIDFTHAELKPKMILLALWERDGRIEDEKGIEKKRVKYLQTVASIKGQSSGHRNDFLEFKNFATGCLASDSKVWKTFEKYLGQIKEPKYIRLLKENQLG